VLQPDDLCTRDRFRGAYHDEYWGGRFERAGAPAEGGARPSVGTGVVPAKCPSQSRGDAAGARDDRMPVLDGCGCHSVEVLVSLGVAYRHEALLGQPSQRGTEGLWSRAYDAEVYEGRRTACRSRNVCAGALQRTRKHCRAVG
jgi:hypothetical protein